MDLGPVGVWWSGSWEVPGQADLDVITDLEDLGYSAIWSTGGFRPGLSSRFGRMLASSRRAYVASAVVNIWLTAPDELAREVAALHAQHADRFILGLGVSHGPFNPGYARPHRAMVEYLDGLDAASPTVGTHRRMLAALGPRMLELAAQRSAGAHPYFVPVEHTAMARKVIGDGPLLAPEVTVVLESDPATARQLGRSFTTGYLTTLPNYVNNLRRLGYSDEDVADGGSDRLVDALVAWGTADTVAARVKEHHDAGADHVCLQVITGAEGFPLGQYRELAAALLGS